MGIFLCGVLGLAIDVGQLYAQRQMAQAAADSAAQAGIMSIFNGTNTTSSHPFGTGSPPIATSVCTPTDLRTPCVYARYNGFGGTSADTVTLSFPTTVSGVTLGSGSVPALAVTVQRQVKTGLTRFIPGAPVATTITAKATSGLVGMVSPNCIYVLSPTGTNAFLVNNGATVTANGCGIMVNSSNTVAATVTGGSVVTASAINVTGGVVVSGGSTVTPAAATGASTGADPFASVPAPVFGTCDYNNFSKGFGTWTITPGVYCGGISLHNGAVTTFSPGTYIVNGGGLSLAGGTTTGSGVMVYLTGTNASYASVTISNGATLTLSAQTSGAYMGLIFFQDRSITSASVATFNGGSTMQLTGSLYFPTTSVLFSNGAGVGGTYTGIVANQVSFLGGTSLRYDSTGLKTGLFSKSVALVQ